MNRLPQKITPCPIIEAVIEIRFSPIIPAEAVFGVIYNKIKDEFNDIKKLPILQIPEMVRSMDQNLKYQTHYSLIKKSEPLQLNIGPQSLVFSNINEYLGWNHFYGFVSKILVKISETDVINLPERIGVRYINFFKNSVLCNLNLSIKLNDIKLSEQSTNFRTEFVDGNDVKVIQVSNNVPINLRGKNVIGSLIDIDCISNFTKTGSSAFDSFYNIINECHNIEKETFFEILDNDFLNTLNPDY